jgi:CRP/FNR family transcriptional regulator, nitrogen fixation regulation protein
MGHQTNTIAGRAIESMHRIGTLLDCAANDVIYSIYQPAEFWYRVVDGAVREISPLANGRRDIVDFLLPGDVFGIASGENYEHSTEAVIPTTLERFSRLEGERLAQSDATVAFGVDRLGDASRDRLRARTALLAHASAPAKVGGFLLQMMARTHRDSDDPIELPMSRGDIADHLGLSMETVCRALTALRTQKLVALEGTRRVRLTDPLRLAKLARVDSALVPPSRHDRVRNVCLALATQTGR